ncbi:hypothetical protein A2943_02270 [Candidatus Adlerbacteria bacterium RIFCSPLOWO2_01_FULL_51_16]|uniref:Uncharacterized protein n=1 Tax=Candidatus Adlerbacteria bacterium RIFCSPLOWO2_01_FULL_51_16 TaxID=1797243 RepID=A0A1F4XG72_9BACT|nr:MAG: hypothetical protein A2943_02270 [Candidatus Adlerbacteria bacterium RIFCSPLOWO2_01_FULL_51_16]
MGNVDFLNIEYLLLRVYKLFSGVSTDTSGFSDWVASFWTQLTIAGLTLAFIFLIVLVLVRIRLVGVEHEALHKREEEARQKIAALEEAKGNARWERVVALISTPDENNWRLAILEADTMLEELLNEQGYTGETVGEQLKSANPLQFTTLDLAWQAHKVRNAIAHLGQAYPLLEREARATIDLYARVFEEFGII